MNFLLDENLPPSLAPLLMATGHPARHVIEIGFNATADTLITDFARASGEIILTHDLDFTRILALSGEIRPSVIQFRLKKLQIDILLHLTLQCVERFGQELKNGSLLTVDERSIRVRKLPIRAVK
jgi:predicted nuclease of predicted toxin-antitoxin system